MANRLAHLSAILVIGGAVLAPQSVYAQCFVNPNGEQCCINPNGSQSPPGCKNIFNPPNAPPKRASDGLPLCPLHFYRCALNKGGQIDPAHPNCCWDLTR